MRTTKILAVCTLLVSVMLSGCSWFGSDKSADPVLAYAGMSDEEQLKKRINERWNALIAMDMATLYSYATPTYRATFDLAHFKNQYGGQVQRKRIDIDRIEIDDAGTSAKVNVVVWSETSGFGGPNIELSTISKGAWVKRDGLWWYVEPR